MAPWTVARQALLSVHGILQARILEWVAMPFSKGSPHNIFTYVTLNYIYHVCIFIRLL